MRSSTLAQYKGRESEDREDHTRRYTRILSTSNRAPKSPGFLCALCCTLCCGTDQAAIPAQLCCLALSALLSSILLLYRRHLLSSVHSYSNLPTWERKEDSASGSAQSEPRAQILHRLPAQARRRLPLPIPHKLCLRGQRLHNSRFPPTAPLDRVRWSP